MVIVIEAFNEFVDEFASILGDNRLDPNTFITYTIIMITLFFGRYEMMDNTKSVECGRKKTQSYILGHLCIELFIAYVVGYSVIKLTSANPENYGVNYIIAPMIGIVLGIFVDTKFFIPLEKSTIFNISKRKSKDKDDDSHTTVNINIDGTNNADSDLLHSDIAHPEHISHLDKDIVDSDDFNSLIIDSINNLKDAYCYHSIIINNNTKKIDESIEILSKLRESAMNDKRVELKAMMYECLSKGFVTPVENDKITFSYHSYVLLGGNSEIKSLYEDHYLNLKIHEEGYVPHNKSHEHNEDYTPICEYGKYD